MMDLTPQPWMTDAACVDHPTLTPDAWFPSEKKISDANRDAIAVCEGCPVRADCALFHAQHQCEGIWGGSIRRQTWHSPGATLRAKAGERERAVMHLHRAGSVQRADRRTRRHRPRQRPQDHPPREGEGGSHMSHPDLSWMDDALCIEIGTDPFFPEPNDWAGSQQAQRICARCPVRQQCSDYADTLPWLQGIWAGKTAHQRYQARKAAA